jgi:hypothetical protein
MYLPCLVLPYQRLPGLWKTPESVLTQTMPLALAGGAGREAELALAAGGVVLAGALEGRGWLGGTDEAVEDGDDCEAAEGFLERLFFGAGAAAPLAEAAIAESSADADFFLLLLLEDFVEADTSADSEEASAPDFLGLVFEDFLEAELSAEADDFASFFDLAGFFDELASADSVESEFFFFDLLVLEEEPSADSDESDFLDFDDFLPEALELLDDFEEAEPSSVGFFFFLVFFGALESL